jgi:hypothetical protein
MDVRNIAPVQNKVKLTFGRGCRQCPNSLGFGRGVDESTSALLMHEDEVPALLQSGVHRAATEWPAAPQLAFLRPLESVFKLRARNGVIENFRPPFHYGLIDDFSDEAEIIERIHRTPSFSSGKIAGRSAAILGGTGLVAIRAKRIGSFGQGLQTLFEPDFVAPRNVQVVFVGEARAPPEAKAFQRHLGLCA